MKCTRLCSVLWDSQALFILTTRSFAFHGFTHLCRTPINTKSVCQNNFGSIYLLVVHRYIWLDLDSYHTEEWFKVWTLSTIAGCWCKKLFVLCFLVRSQGFMRTSGQLQLFCLVLENLTSLSYPQVMELIYSVISSISDISWHLMILFYRIFRCY